MIPCFASRQIGWQKTCINIKLKKCKKKNNDNDDDRGNYSNLYHIKVCT